MCCWIFQKISDIFCFTCILRTGLRVVINSRFIKGCEIVLQSIWRIVNYGFPFLYSSLRMEEYRRIDLLRYAMPSFDSKSGKCSIEFLYLWVDHKDYRWISRRVKRLHSRVNCEVKWRIQSRFLHWSKQSQCSINKSQERFDCVWRSWNISPKKITSRPRSKYLGEVL